LAIPTAHFFTPGGAPQRTFFHQVRVITGECLFYQLGVLEVPTVGCSGVGSAGNRTWDFEYKTWRYTLHMSELHPRATLQLNINPVRQAEQWKVTRHTHATAVPHNRRQQMPFHCSSEQLHNCVISRHGTREATTSAWRCAQVSRSVCLPAQGAMLLSDFNEYCDMLTNFPQFHQYQIL
jgi:hypothetical protein